MDDTNNTTSGLLGVLSGNESLKGQISISPTSIWMVSGAIVATAAIILIMRKFLK